MLAQRAHLIDKRVATSHKVDDGNNQLAMMATLHEHFDCRGGSRRAPPRMLVCLAQTNPTEPLPGSYGMDGGQWDQVALVQAVQEADVPDVDPSTVPTEPGHAQWVCGTGTSEHVRHRVFLDVWFQHPETLNQLRSVRQIAHAWFFAPGSQGALCMVGCRYSTKPRCSWPPRSACCGHLCTCGIRRSLSFALRGSLWIL